MPRKAKSTHGAADSVGGAVTREALDAAKQEPNLNAAIVQLTPYTKSVRDIVAGLFVRNETERVVMADVLRQIKTGMEAVDSRFDPITKPLWAAWKAAVTWRNEVRGPLEEAEQIGKERLGGYEVALARALELETAQREIAEREQRDRDRARTIAMEREPVANLAGFSYIPAYTPPPPQPVPQAPAVYADPMATIRGPVPLTGVSTIISWDVEVLDDAAATAALIQFNMWHLAGCAPFVQLDPAALKAAIKGNTEHASLLRQSLAGCPGLQIVQSAQVRTTGYE